MPFLVPPFPILPGLVRTAIDEAEQLCRLLGKSIITAKTRRNR